MGMNQNTTIPAPPPYMTCGCGREYDEKTWPHIGVYVDEVEYQEYRNCPCGSTHAAVLPGGAG